MTSERLDKTVNEPKFFTGKERFFLETLSPQRFTVSLPNEYLFVHIAGAAWDSFNGLGDKQKSSEFLNILKSEIWTKNQLVKNAVNPNKQVATAIAFLIENDGIPFEEHVDFIEFCKENDIVVTKKQIEKIAKKIKKNKI